MAPAPAVTSSFFTTWRLLQLYRPPCSQHGAYSSHAFLLLHNIAPAPAMPSSSFTWHLLQPCSSFFAIWCLQPSWDNNFCPILQFTFCNVQLLRSVVTRPVEAWKVGLICNIKFSQLHKVTSIILITMKLFWPGSFTLSLIGLSIKKITSHLTFRLNVML